MHHKDTAAMARLWWVLLAGVASAFNVPAGNTLAPSCRSQPSAVRMGWIDAQRRRKEAEQAQYEALAKAKQEADAENARVIEEAQRARAEEESRRNERAAAYQDNVDLYRPGGVMRQASSGVTREMLANSQKTQSPAMLADEALKAALSKAVTAAQLLAPTERLYFVGLHLLAQQSRSSGLSLRLGRL